MTNIAIEHGHRNSEFSHEKWWFSIVTLVYQRAVWLLIPTWSGWWWLEHGDNLWLSIYIYIGNFVIPTDFHIFFQRGRYTTNQWWFDGIFNSDPWCPLFEAWLNSQLPTTKKTRPRKIRNPPDLTPQLHPNQKFVQKSQRAAWGQLVTSLPLPKLRSMVRVLLQVGEFFVAFFWERIVFYCFFFLNVFFMLFQWAQPHDIPSGNLLHSYWKWW